MDGFGWQDAVVALAAGAAIAWLVRRRMRSRRPTPFCDDCPACGTDGTSRGATADAAPENGRLIPESELIRR